LLSISVIYRYGISSRPVLWRACLAGAVAAVILTLAASWAAALYVQSSQGLGAAYGSVTAVVILLIWLSWSVQAVFLGGALATEVERLIEGQSPQA
jgi:membrane protein